MPGAKTDPTLTGVERAATLRRVIPPRKTPRPTTQWIDQMAGIAYISVLSRIQEFRDFLDGVEQLISHPKWQPGMPVIEDLRGCQWIPPDTSIAEWRSYVAAHKTSLGGCRWAVVRDGATSRVEPLLDAAEDDAALSGLVLQRFTSMVEAHVWARHAARR
jgi:hypothetical protein